MFNYNYNLKDKDTFYWIHNLCMIGDTIPFYNKTIHIPKVKDIMSLRKTEYLTLINIYSLDKKSLFYTEDLNKVRDIDFFKILLDSNDVEKNEYFKTLLFTSLSYFLQEDMKNFYIVPIQDKINVYINSDNNMFVLNSEKFKELSAIMRLIFKTTVSDISKERAEKEKFQKNFGKVKKRFAKLLKARETREEENDETKEFCNIFNVILPMNNFDYNSICNKNIYQFYNDYMIYNAKTIEDFNFNIYSSGNVSLNKDFNIDKDIKANIKRLIEYKNDCI